MLGLLHKIKATFSYVIIFFLGIDLFLTKDHRVFYVFGIWCALIALAFHYKSRFWLWVLFPDKLEKHDEFDFRKYTRISLLFSVIMFILAILF